MCNKDGETLRTFKSITEAYDFLSVSIGGNIGKCLKNKQKTAYGYIWRESTFRTFK